MTPVAPPSVFPFIVGSGRSGTTLLRAMLDSHQEMAIPPESHFIVPMARTSDRYESAGRFQADAFLEDLLVNEWFMKWELPEKEVRAAFEDKALGSYSEAIRTLYACYASHQGKPRYADKTPAYVKYLVRLGELFPEGKFIHIIRDGRDVALSYLRLYIDDVEEAARKWKKAVHQGREAGAKLGSSRYQEVRYEELISNPEAALRSLCTFVGMEFNSVMLRYFERAEEIVAGTRDPGRHQNLFRPPTLGLRDWRTQMTKEDVASFERVAGKQLEAVGYERGS